MAIEDLRVKFERMADEMERSRSVGREVIYRIVVLSAGIVGFSATVLSIDELDVTVNTGLLRVSWLLFVAVIFLGPLSLFLESRSQYAITWRANQAQDFDERRPTTKERAQLIALMVYAVLVRPRTLFWVRDTDYGDARKAWLNGRLVQRLHLLWDIALALEIVFWALFASALALLLLSVSL